MLLHHSVSCGLDCHVFKMILGNHGRVWFQVRPVVQEIIPHVKAVCGPPGKEVAHADGCNAEPAAENQTPLNTGLNLREIVNKLVVGNDRDSTLEFLHHVSHLNCNRPG